MAAASPWNDIDDKFCLCSICLEQLKEPKLIPCLHRYCKECLDSIIRRSHDVIKCPECREEIQIPTNGVEGFKTDFYSKSLVEHVQIQQSLKSDEVRECYSCSKHLRVAAYCFKCNDFLCKDCYDLHVANRILKDHRKHTLSLEDIESKNITIERLASMRDAPRCNIHPEKISELFCETCSSLPVCVACTHGEHKGHNLHEVKALAKMRRENLSQNLKTLDKVKKDDKLINPRQVQEKLALNVSIEKAKLKKMHNEKAQEIITKIQDVKWRQEQVNTAKQNTEKKIFDSLQKEMEKEIGEIKKKYEEIMKKKKIEISADFQTRERSLERDLIKLYENLERFDTDKKKLLQSIDEQWVEKVKNIQKVSQHVDNVEKRFKTLNVLAYSILASENDWSAAQCIPDICAAATNLLKDLKKDFPDLLSLADLTVNYKHSSLGNASSFQIPEHIEREFTINARYYYLFGVTSGGDGNIVISGCPFKGEEAFIIVIDLNGNVMKQMKLHTEKTLPNHFCDFLSHSRVVSLYTPTTLGLYDMREGWHIGKNINDVIDSWPKDRPVTCVATDPVNNHILVGGGGSKDVYVFDNQLNYLQILALPEMIKWPRDITISDGQLLVCDYEGKKAYVTTMEGLGCKLVSEFVKPDLKGEDWRPMSVCTDTNGFVYMMWWDHWCGSQRYLVQYTHDGRQVLATRKMDSNAYAIAAIVTSQGEKLVVVTLYTQKVYLYGLGQIDEE